MPAAHTLVAAAIFCTVPSAPVISTPTSSRPVTMVPRWTSTPMRPRSRAVILDSRVPMLVTRPSAPSTSTTRVEWGSMRR